MPAFPLGIVITPGVASWTCLAALYRAIWPHGQTIVPEISLFAERVQHSGFYDFDSRVLYREVSLRELNAKIPFLPLMLITISAITQDSRP